jgi:dTMP kinase
VTQPTPTDPGPATSGGFFVAFEGGDGAGKSTQVRRLAEVLEAAGRRVVVTRQPGGTPLGAALRDLVLHGDHVSARAEALLFAADKAQHVEEVIAPALAQGAVVVTDRYTDSSVAYQGAGRLLRIADVERLLDWAVAGLYPDLTVLLDVTPQTGRMRRGAVHDRLELEHDAFHERVRRLFLTLAEAAPARYLVLDARLSPGRLHARIVERLQEMGVAE